MKSFPSLYLSNLFLVGGTGLLTTYLALFLAQKNVDNLWVGLLTSFYYLGLLSGAKIGYYLIKSVGHIRAFAASTGVVTACAASHGLIDNLQVWLLLRLFVGIGMMCNYMILESWLNEQAAPEQRGKVFSFYMLTSYLGMILGQVALAQYSPETMAPLFLVCIALSVGIIPLSITRRIHPKPLKPIKVSIWAFFKKIPQSLTAVLFAGIINGSFYGLAPIYASKSNLDATEIAMFMSITIFAGFVAQWPMGLLSDKIRRSLLLRSNAILITIFSIGLFIVPTSYGLTLPLTFCFGLVAFTIYPLASALGNSRVTDDDRVGVSSALLVTFGAGASLGSVGIARVMDYLGHESLYGAIAVLATLMFVLLTFINSKQKSERPKTTDYVATTSDVTSSPLAATLDPRIDEGVAQEQLLLDKDALDEEVVQEGCNSTPEEDEQTFDQETANDPAQQPKHL